MKYCPYYKNKDVFDGFNKIITSLGGRPMTEEEFRSSPLRNQREGLDYSAMEIAYRVYDRNGGNFLDLTPDGKPSLLYQTLLDYYHGDEASAIVAKSNVYSDEFFNWFGDWTGNFNSEQFDEETKRQISLIFKRIPKLSEIGTEELYAKYIQTIFPESKDKSIYWHGSNSDFSDGFKSAKREEGSGAPETKKRNDFYLAKQAWSVLLYVSGVNRKSVDKNGFSIWNKLWWEFKEIMSNGRRENNDWKDLVINEETVRQAIPNKKGIFNRDKGGDNGKWLKERKADYGYENKSDKEFFEEILGVRWGIDTFNTWTQRNAEIFKSLLETENGIYPAVINTINPIREKGQDTYYEEHRGLFTKADADGNDAILGSETDNEFGSDVAVVLRDNSNVHFLGTQEDMDAFSKFVNRQNVSKVVDANGEPLVVYHRSDAKSIRIFRPKDYGPKHSMSVRFGEGASFFTDNKNDTRWGKYQTAYFLNIKTPFNTSFQIESNENAVARYKQQKEDRPETDGIFNVAYDENYKYDELIVFNTNQIKHVENLGTWSKEDDNIYYLMVGPRGALLLDNEERVSLRIDNLSVAKQMENAGKDPLTIKIATGWERGVDGKWRYEIPDIKFKEDGFGDYEIRAVVGNSLNSYVERDMSEVFDLSNLPQTYREELEYVGVVRIYDDPFDANKGSYNIEDGKVVFYINLGADEHPKSIIAHELQHFIQEREGFQPGGNPSMSIDALLKQRGIYDVYNKLLDNSNGYRNTLARILSNDEKYKEYENISFQLDRYLDMVDLENTSEENVINFIKLSIPTWKEGVNYSDLAELRKLELIKEHAEELENAKKSDEETYKKIQAILRTLPSSYDAYLRLAGEAEARAVAKRTFLSKDEKISSLLKDDIYEDVAKEDLIFLYDEQSVVQEDISYFTQTNLTDSFGQKLSGKLINGETVSSRDLMKYMIDNMIYHSSNIKLARALSRHDVPVRIGYTMRNGEFAKTVTENGGSVIYINPNELSQVSRGYASTTIMHELVHAITVDIIDNPKTEEDKAFVESNRMIYKRLSKGIKHINVHTMNALTSMYAFENEKEFAAVFASDPEARLFIYEYAERLDRINRTNKFTNALKNLINRLVKAFGKRAIFDVTNKTAVQLLEEYETTLRSFLQDASIIERGNIPSKSVLHKVYNQIDARVQNHEDFIEDMKELERIGTALKNYLLGIRRVKRNDGNIQVSSFEDVIRALKTRISAIKGSTYDEVTRGKLLSQTLTLIDMFLLEEGGKYIAINHLLKSAVPLLLEDLDELRKIKKDGNTFSNSDYMYQMHANAGMYGSIFKQIATWLQSDENVEGMLEFYNKTLKEGDEPLTKEDIDTLFASVQNAQTFADLIVGNLEYMLRENGIEKLRDLAEKAGSQDMESYINALNSKDADKLIEDIGMWESLATPSDSSSNEAIRALSFMINNALDKAQMDSFDKSVDLQILQKGLKRGEKAWLCYEVDENGRFTGYLVRDLNFGRFKRDYDNEIIRINKILADKFGLTTLNVNHNRVAPEGEDGQRVAVVTVTENGRDVTKEMTAKEFFDYSKEMWLIDHCERKYTAEYYKKYAMLPQSIKTQLLAIKTQISAITSNYDNLYDDKNIPHYEVLSDEDWIKLNQLWERRRFLSKDVDEFGHQKEGTELEAARLLRQLYEELYHINDDDKKNKERPKDIKGWKAARNEIIRQFGEDSEQLKKWDERNSKKVFKQNEFGEVIVFKLIEDEFGDSKIFYSDKYEELKEAKKLLLSNFRMLNGEYDADSINTTLENAIHTIDEEMFKERMKIRYGDETFASRAAAYSEIFKRHIKFVESTLLQRARKNAEVEALRIAAEEEEIDPFTARSVLEIVDQMLSEKYGEIKYDDDLFLLGADDGVFNPYSYYTRMESVDPDLMEVIPNDGWAIDKEDNNNLNDKFDEKYGEAWVPKRSIYDNTEAFNKFNENSSEFSESLRAMYDGLYNTIKEANELMQLEYQDNYMLPQVECTSLERLGRKGTLKSIARMFGWGRFYGRVEDPNDQERGQDYKEIANTADNGTEELARTYPDGRDYHSIPRYFTKKLEHPELISKNAVGIVWDYYRNARRYSERSKIKDDCEMIADLIKRQQFKKDKRAVGGKEGEESNTYQYVRNLIERDLYDIRRVKLLSNVTIDYTKIARLIQRLTTAINLGMSPKVAMVGFFTTMYTHIMNGITGYKYSFWDMFKSLGIVLKEFGLSLFGAKFLGNRLTKNKIIKLLELADLADQGSRKLEHSNRIPKIVQFIYKNSTFGLMTAADVIAKSTITVATLLSYRLVDGKFMTRHEIEESRVALGEEEYKRLMSEFEKSNVNAYNAILDDTSVKEKLKHPFTNTGDTKVKINPEYETAWNEIRDRALTTAIKNAEDADGIATRMQKAMMTRNAIGAFVLIHRQYIPLMLSKMFGKRVYDYDTHEYKNAQFRTMFLYISQLACSSTLAATVGGGFAGVAFGGFAPITLMVGGGSAAAYSIYKKVQNKRRGIKRKTIRLVNEEFLGGGLKSIFTGTSKNIYTNDSKTYANQVQNRYQLKQTIMEVLLYNLVTLPCVNALCMAADSTDKDDDYWKWIILQTLAYWARATQFESNTKYNMLDLASAIKTGTAAFNTIDSYSNLLGGIGKGLGIAGQNLLFGHNMQAETISANIYQLFVQNTDPENEDEDGFEIDDDFYGKSGAYKGYSKLFKSIMKATPAKNMWEQLRDPASKRRYQENLIMRMDKDEKRRLLYFDLFFNDDEEE